MESDAHSKPHGLYRIRPAPPGGQLGYVKIGNESVRDVPAAERMLEVVCHDAGSRKGPRLVAIVTKDWQIRGTEGQVDLTEPGRFYTRCRCRDDGHTLVLAKLVQKVDLLQHRPSKGRRVDVRAVT
jgi:hypothetical protein